MNEPGELGEKKGKFAVLLLPIRNSGVTRSASWETRLWLNFESGGLFNRTCVTFLQLIITQTIALQRWLCCFCVLSALSDG